MTQYPWAGQRPLEVPHLADCRDRRREPRRHPTIGEPPDWFASADLQSLNLGTVSFDFFVQWADLSCGREIWIKRISPIDGAKVAEARGTYLDTISPSAPIDDAILLAFSEQYTFEPIVQVFRDNVDWQSSHEKILRVTLSRDGIRSIELQSVRELMGSIRRLRGGNAPMGAKGLRYGTSTLECYLSATDAIWPGDVDMVLWRTDRERAVALFEWKKHNLLTAIADQTLGNYYPRPDRRKYDAIAVLRDRLDPRLPIFAVFYPTAREATDVKVELIRGACESLVARGSRLVATTGLALSEIGMAVISAARDLLSEEAHG